MRRLLTLLLIVLAGCGGGTGTTSGEWEGSWSSGTRTGPATLNYRTSNPTGTILYRPTGETINFTIRSIPSANPPACSVVTEADYAAGGRNIVLDCSTHGTFNLVVFPRP